MLFDELVRLDDPEPHSAALNMAIDEALLRAAEKPILRCYRWANAAVSFGYFGKFAEVSDEWPKRELVRRWTGGGVVPHGSDFTYSLIIPRGHSFCEMKTAESYRAIHVAVAVVLVSMERGVTLAPSAAAAGSTACFDSPVQYDVIAGDRKIAGAAQRRTQFGLLHQGSIQMTSFPETMAELLANAFAQRVETRVLTEEIATAAESLVREKYGADAWFYRV